MLTIKEIYNAIPARYKDSFNYIEQDHSIKFILREPIFMEIVISEFPLNNLEICFNYITPSIGRELNVKLVQFCAENNIVQQTPGTTSKDSTYDIKLASAPQDRFKLNIPHNNINDLKNLICFLKATLIKSNSSEEFLLETLEQAIFENKSIIIEENVSEGSIIDDNLSYKIIQVADLSDLDDITRKVENEKKLALENGQKILMLKIISENKQQPIPHSSSKISFGVGLPSEGNLSKEIPIENLERIIRKIRNIPSFNYIDDNIFFANGAMLLFDLEQEADEKTTIKPDNLAATINIEDYIEIRYISDSIGFGVFAKKNIPAGAHLGIYAGMIGLPDTCRGYALSDATFPTLINSERYGNWAHLVNHAFMQTPPDTLPANIEEKWTSDANGYRRPELVSNKAIPKGTQLFFDYEQPYWNWTSRSLNLCTFKNDNTIVNASKKVVPLEISEGKRQIFNKYCISSPTSSRHHMQPNKELRAVKVAESRDKIETSLDCITEKAPTI